MIRRHHREGRGAPRVRAVVLSWFAAIALAPAPRLDAAAAEVIAPGSASWAPVPAQPHEIVPPQPLGAEIEAEGLYSYITPFAPPRWLRLQQAGEIIWGSIDINDSFGMCTRARFDGTISGDVLWFTVPMDDAHCPCSGPGALITFTGTVDTAGTIVGTWTNNCTPPPPGTWTACWVPEEPAGGSEATETCYLPDNAPPDKVRQTPAGGPWVWGMAAAALVALAAASLVRRRVAVEARG